MKCWTLSLWLKVLTFPSSFLLVQTAFALWKTILRHILPHPFNFHLWITHLSIYVFTPCLLPISPLLPISYLLIYLLSISYLSLSNCLYKSSKGNTMTSIVLWGLVYGTQRGNSFYSKDLLATRAALSYWRCNVLYSRDSHHTKRLSYRARLLKISCSCGYHIEKANLSYNQMILILGYRT